MQHTCCAFGALKRGPRDPDWLAATLPRSLKRWQAAITIVRAGKISNCRTGTLLHAASTCKQHSDVAETESNMPQCNHHDNAAPGQIIAESSGQSIVCVDLTSHTVTINPHSNLKVTDYAHLRSITAA